MRKKRLIRADASEQEKRLRGFQVLALMIVLMATSASALDTKDQPALDRWAKQKKEALFKDCSKTSRKDWFKRYDSIELALLEKLEEIGAVALKDRKNSPEFWSWVSVVYPQDLPKGYPLKGAYLTCFDEFKRYKEGKIGFQPFDECQQAAYRTDAPPALKEYLGCLKKMKS